MIGSLPALSGALHRATLLRQRAATQGLLSALLWQSAAALMAAGLLDILWPCPALLRGLGLLAGIGVIGRRLRRLRQQRQQGEQPEERLAREMEAQRPELDNALIHAVQFAPILALEPNAPGAVAMRREIARADTEMARLPLENLLARAPQRREHRRALVALGLLIVTTVLFPRAYRFEIPRLFLFWADYPPFTLTDFTVTPTHALIHSGDSLTVTCRIGGQEPHSLELQTGAAGEPPQSTPLLPTGPNVYAAQLDNLQKETWFRVVADTGRTSRYWIRLAPPAPAPARKPDVTPPPAPDTRPKESPAEATPAQRRSLAQLAEAQARLAKAMQAAAKRKSNSAKAQAQAGKLRRQQHRLQQQAQKLTQEAQQAAQKNGTPSSLARNLQQAQTAMRQAQTAAGLEAMRASAQDAADQLKQTLQGAGGPSEGDDPSLAQKSPSRSGQSQQSARAKEAASGQTAEARPRRNPRDPFGALDQEGLTSGQERTPSRGANGEVSRYPPQYRQLVRDYFKAVAGGK